MQESGHCCLAQSASTLMQEVGARNGLPQSLVCRTCKHPAQRHAHADLLIGWLRTPDELVPVHTGLR